jgi:hypothetical protein
MAILRRLHGARLHRCRTFGTRWAGLPTFAFLVGIVIISKLRHVLVGV